MSWVTTGLRIAAINTVVMMLMLSGAIAQAELPWRPNSLISLTADGEEITDILRTILRSNGMIAIFRGDVNGIVDLDEEDVPAHGIFNQLITEFDLQFRYDEATRTVTIQPKVVASVTPKEAPPVRDFVVPRYVKFTVVRAVLEKFGFGADGITFDDASGTISLFGEAGRVQDIKLLIEQLDKSAEDRQSRELDDQRAAYEAQLYQELLSAKVKVIPLRYASVSATTKTFQGKSISVPGIENTLQAILGVQIQKPGWSAPIDWSSLNVSA